MTKLNILVVEDDKLAQKVMAGHLRAHNVDLAGDKKTALAKLAAGHYDLCFFDLMLGPKDDYSGLKLIPIAVSKGFYSVVMSGSDSDEIINKAYELGCKDFYSKGNEESNVEAVIRKYFQSRTGTAGTDIFANRFVTADPATRAAVSEALKYAPSELPILVLGPSGTGKTSLAKIIHEYSGREGSFVAINCSAYTEDLLEAELFGYKKGAFTGAGENRKGRLLEAHKGTLFLDEIGTMSLNMQMKLLKAIEERSFYPLGSDKPEHSEFRIISATLEDIQRLISLGKMRLDLFQRIHGFTIDLSPLSRRRNDIFPLITHFTAGTKRLAFSPEGKTYILDYAWPGNIRELKRFSELLVSGSEGRIDLATVKKHLTASGCGAAAGQLSGEGPYRHALSNGLERTLDRIAYEIIQRSLADNGGKKTKTLSDLKISTRFLYSTLNKFGAETHEDRKPQGEDQ